MRVMLWCNAREELGAEQTTAHLATELLRRGHTVAVAGLDDLGRAPDASVRVHAVALQGPVKDTDAFVAGLRAGKAQACSADGYDLLLLRTNPARDPARTAAHATLLQLAEAVGEAGVAVVNDPRGLARAGTKHYLMSLPAAVRPRSLVTRRWQDALEFVRSCPGGAVLKPLNGTHGLDVFRVAPGERSNLRQLVEVVRRRGFVMVQEFLPAAAEGDLRVHVLQGRILEVGGRASAIRRVPGGDDFRSNVHAGGHAVPDQPTAGMRAAVEQIGPRLRADGLFFVGLDFVGEHIIELNAFAPGGLQQAEAQQGRPFTEALLDALQAEPPRLSLPTT